MIQITKTMKIIFKGSSKLQKKQIWFKMTPGELNINMAIYGSLEFIDSLVSEFWTNFFLQFLTFFKDNFWSLCHLKYEKFYF